MRIFKTGNYRFSIKSDDGSKLWIDNRFTINNDGAHGWRNREATKKLGGGWHLVRLEMFERGGHAGMLFRYKGGDTGNRWAVARARGMRKSGHRATYRHGLFMENAFYFGQGNRCQNLNGRKPNMARWRHTVSYGNTNRKWSGFRRSDNFAVRWTGRLRIFRTGHYHFQLISDDGSKLWIDNRYTINNDGLHGWRSRTARRHVRGGWRLVRLEMFERGGHAGMLFRYHGPDTGNRWIVARAGGRRHRSYPITYRAGLFMENAFYFGQGGRCQNLNGRRPNMARWRHVRVQP